MASESRMSERDAALRRLLVERADADGRRRRRSGGGAGRLASSPVPGRLRAVAVTGVVLVAVVTGSVAVLDTVHVPPSGTSPTRVAPAPARSTDAPTPTTAPTPTASRSAAPLIAKRGAEVRSRTQLHAFVAADPILEGDPVWEEQAWLKIGCMAEAGFLYDPVTEASAGESGGAGDGLTAAEAAAFEVALYGPRTDAAYDWRTAGCDGLAVHETGQDDAN